MLDLWVIRHGETDWNVEGRVQGWTDVPLNQNGLNQATQLARTLQGIPFQTIIASDLERAERTAHIIQSYVGAPLQIDGRLRERCYGVAEGIPRKDMLARYRDGVPEAETEFEIQTRAKLFLVDLANGTPDGRVLCVSHGGWIRAMLQTIGATDLPTFTNTCVNRLQWTAVGGWKVIAVNRTDHLASCHPDTPIATSTQSTMER